MKHIFISYAHTDWEYANRVVTSLEDSGYPVWIDKTGIPVSSIWVKEIDNALKKSLAVVWIVSKSSLASPYVISEVITADNLGIKVYPVLIEEVEISFLLSARHYISLVGKQFDIEFKEILNGLPEIDDFKSDETVDETVDLQDKLNQLDNTLQVIAIGAVYADVHVPDTHLHALGDSEMIINSIERKVGGSTWLIAKYLQQTNLHDNVHLITAIGDKSTDTEDSNAHFVGNRLEKSNLLVTNDGEGIWWFKRQTTATTFIFEDKNRPMLTSPGIIADLDWNIVRKQIDHNSQINFDNNIIYIGGYFKSALYKDIGDMLHELDDKKCIIFMDPGRFTWINPFTIDPDVDKEEAIQVDRQIALRDNLHYVDIYSATDTEFRCMFMDIFQGLGRFNIGQALEHLQQQPINLPQVMIIRDRQQGHVYIRIDNHINLVKARFIDDLSSGRYNYIRSSSQFDARFIHYMSTQFQLLSNESLTDFVEASVHFAIGNTDLL